MIRRLFLLSFIMGITVGQLYGQQSHILKIGVQKKYSPTFKVNNEIYRKTDANEIRLSIYNFERIPVSVEFYFSKGYDSSVDFSYGTRLSYIFFHQSPHWIKAGISGGRFKMGEFKRGKTVGAIREDEFHENIKPFVEWDWRFSKYVSLFANTGYRFLRSNTETVTEVYERYENGDPKKVRVKGSSKIYGSGLEFGIGLNVSLYSFDK